MPNEQDDWEAPDEFWQILQRGGWVTNVSSEDYETMKVMTEEFTASGFYEIEDIYGDTALLKISSINGAKHWTRRGGQRWKKTHEEESREF